MDAPLTRLESVLASQQGLVTRAQLLKEDFTETQVRSLMRRKVLRRTRRNVYSLVGSSDSWERGLLAVVLSVPGSIASHSSAARMWNFDPRPEDRYEITVPRDCYVDIPGVVLHRSRIINEQDVTTRHGIATTSFERALADCTVLLGEYQLSRVLDDGLRRGVASLRRLSDCLERTDSGPGRHMSIVRSLLAQRGVGFDPGGSRSELQVLEVFRRAGLPMPIQQYQVRVGASNYRPDFAWPDRLVFAEYYGLPFHTGAAAVVSDSKRLTALVAAGWLPLVFTHASTDREIIEQTTAALSQRRDGRENGT